MMRVSPFRRGKVYWARIPRLEADAVQRSLGTDDRATALEICTYLRWLRGRRESFLLDQIALGKVPVGPGYTAYVENRLDRYIVELRDGVTDVDLEPFVARWQKELARRKAPNAETRAKYLRQVRTLLEEGKPFKRSTFTKQRIRDWLEGLGIGQPNRHRAALSSFAEFLVFEDVLPGNPVRLVPAASEADPRTRHLTPLDAKRLVEKFEDDDYRAFHALMLATGMEFGAARVVDPATVTEDGAYAAGTKKHHRRRTVTITARWRWAWEIATAWLALHKDGTQPFAAIDPYTSNRVLRKALRAAKLDVAYTQHDHRHTWAVQAIRDGLALHAIAHQLGHRDATMVLKVYGRFQPSGSDFRSKSDPFTSMSATPPISDASESASHKDA